MSGLKLLGEGSQYYAMQSHQRFRKSEDLEVDAIPFSGALRHHYNPNMVLLLTHPWDRDGVVFEFRQEDIIFAEELSSQTRPDGVTVEMAKLWLKKGSIAMKMQPVRVGDSEE
ncbi:MAG: inorganic pyrophosphatase Ppa [SAR324 cluster bacterium]|nr:inorganic pyrophosphatase Ppa [SAR324 cluster bacterium]MBF0349410.1 inorganic pyrophosphatase Ppa [SAR324 cluster bacterium]